MAFDTIIFDFLMPDGFNEKIYQTKDMELQYNVYSIDINGVISLTHLTQDKHSDTPISDGGIILNNFSEEIWIYASIVYDNPKMLNG